MLTQLGKLVPAKFCNDLTDWNVEQGLLLYQSKVYVPKDQGLHAEIIWAHHNMLMVGHSGQWKTVELIARNYYWSGMIGFIRDYIQTCDTCH